MRLQLSYPEAHVLTLRSLTLSTALLASSAAASLAEAPAQSSALAPLLGEIAGAKLQPELAVHLSKLALNIGTAMLRIEDGTFVPASTAGGRISQAVFVGSARLVLEPPDDIERSQLDLFTGERRLNVAIDEAAFVLGSDRAVDAVFNRPKVALEPALATKAKTLFDTWQERPERKVLDIDGALLADGLADPLAQGYFAGWFHNAELGNFLYLVDPSASEQVTLGQFVPLELTEKEKRKAQRLIHKQQRRGRLIGLELDDLGQWDTWLSTSLVDSSSRPAPGLAPFEPARYVIDLALTGRDLAVSGRTRIELVSQTGRTRIVELGLHPELKVKRVTGADGAELPFRQTSGEIQVVLPEAPARDATTTIEVLYEGTLFEKVETGVFNLVNTIQWHPHAGEIDRASYDATFHWPDRLELLAGGTRVDGGKEAGGQVWERRTIDLPTSGLGFEVGKFQLKTAAAGHVAIRLGLPPVAWGEKKELAERLLSGLTDAITYFEEIYGPYPLDELTVVLTPRYFSQSLLGFVTLSSLMMSDNGWIALLLGLEDPRTVIAHEVAHQWWGHQVGWQGYRDQWLSEAMANYSSVVFARNKLGGKLKGGGPTSHWQEELLYQAEDGRPIESLGPLTLGERLVSSRSGLAYSAIVYRKGAVVLDMLARRFGEKNFLEMAKKIVEISHHRAITTELFLSALEKQSGVDLAGFAQQFIYGTGLPEVYYSYDFAPAEEGKWKVSGKARQSAPYHYRYRIVERAPGAFDVARERVEIAKVADSSLIVPVQVALYDPNQQPSEEEKKAAKKKGNDPKETGNRLLQGHLLLKGESTELSLDMDFEPKEVWLDRRQEVFGRFYNERRHPKRMLYYRAVDAAAGTDPSAAEGLCREALKAATFSGPKYDDYPAPDDGEDKASVLDGQIHLLLARLHLDAGRTDAARQAHAEAKDLLDPHAQPWWRGELDLIEARIAIQTKDFDRAYRLLKKGVLKRGTIDAAEGSLLLAIAARATGHADEEKDALKEAKDRGADATALTSAVRP